MSNKTTSLTTKVATAVIGASMVLNANAKPAEPTLWGAGVSPFVRKVQVVLDEKNISYEHKQVLPKMLNDATHQETPKEFLTASVLGKIPALELDNAKMSDSAVISAYLERKFPNKVRLYPKNPEQYARALWFENYGDNVLGTVATKKLLVEQFVKPNVLKMEPNMEIVTTALNQELPEILNYLEKETGKYVWLAGNEFSIADIAIATHFVSLKQINITVDAAKWPNLSQYLQKVFARESFKKYLDA